MVETIDTKKFDELIAGDKTVVCDFFATWCAPCRMISPVIEKCAEKFGDRAVFVKVDIDSNFELAARYEVKGIPLVCVFKGGKLCDKSLGLISQSEADEFFGKAL